MASYRELPPPPGLEAHIACVCTSHDRAALVGECRRLSCLSPAALPAAGATPAGERSDPIKPRRAQFATLAA